MDQKKKNDLQAAMDRVLAGDVNGGINALDQLIGREFERYFVRNGMRTDEAEEAVWELFARAVKPGSGYRGDAPAEHWLNRCKKNMVIDFWRKKELDIVEPIRDDDGEDADVLDKQPAPVVDRDLLACIDAAFAEFRRDFPKRACYLEWITDEWTNEEIAEALGVSLGAARDRLYETRKKLNPYVLPCVESKGK